MTRLPVVTAKDAIRALERAGFVLVRTSGSHQRFVHSEDPSRATTVPAHAGKTLKRGTLRNIIKEAGLTVEEFTAFCEHGVQHIRVVSIVIGFAERAAADGGDQCRAGFSQSHSETFTSRSQLAPGKTMMEVPWLGLLAEKSMTDYDSQCDEEAPDYTLVR